jgi:hypothetical protein
MMPWALAMVEEALALALAWRKTSWMRMALEAQQVVAQQKVRFPGQPGIPKPKQANRQLLMGHLPKVHQTQLSDPDPRLLPSHLGLHHQYQHHHDHYQQLCASKVVAKIAQTMKSQTLQ